MLIFYKIQVKAEPYVATCIAHWALWFVMNKYGCCIHFLKEPT